MNPKYFRALEFDKIRARLASHTSFSASEELARDLAPSTDLDEIKSWQQETTEARALLDQQSGLGIDGARDVRLFTQAARIGALLNPPDFLDIRATLLSARTLRRALSRLNALYPRLAFIAGGLDDVPPLVDAIARALNDRGEVVDEASPELARIRRELNVARSRMMDKLQRIISSSQMSRWLQEPIITQRDGRYVIPVRAEARGRINGIVHDSSASGATLFIEPLSVVDLGNHVRELLIEETREVERILRELTARVAANADELDRTVETLARLDLAFAKANYSAAIKAVEPKLGVPFLQLQNARHPLLDPERVVPISIELGRSFSILIITGPNTGGKTVTLKTVGLLALMAQSGLHIPADEGSQLPVYAGIYADIGDEQSIEQSLSTFSGHMTNIIEILREAAPSPISTGEVRRQGADDARQSVGLAQQMRQGADDARRSSSHEAVGLGQQRGRGSLVLLDELGAGTDPVEGSALARAIIHHLLDKKISALVATHYAELKAFAHSTPGVENASVEFDVETLAPTYRLTIGLPGRSNAFAIATRLGLDPRLVEEARATLTQTDVELETMLAEIKRAKEEAAREQARAAQARENAERAAAAARRQVAEIEKSRGEILNRAREDARAELDAARAELNRLRQEWRRVSLTRDFIEKAEEDLDAVRELTPLAPEPPHQPQVIAPPPDAETIEVGDTVYVPSLDQTGEVIALNEDVVDVQIGAFRAHVTPDQVELRAKGQLSEIRETQRGALVLPGVESPGIEVHLRGMRAEEALNKLDKYLDRAYLAGLPYVRVVHGKGTGTLRKLVRDQLEASPLVVSFETADSHEGGEGVTVAKLVSR